jgi:hypothetical protein
MQKILKMALVVSLMIPLSGCSAIFGTGDYGQYSEALQTHSDAESTRIQAQADAIAEASRVPSSTPTERALLATIAMMQIERLQPIPLGIVKPTTGMDVLGKVVDVVPFVSSTAGLTYLGIRATQAAGNVEIGQNATVSGSLNRPTATSLGEGTVATVQPYDVRPEVVQQPAPVIVEQQVVQPAIVETVKW